MPRAKSRTKQDKFNTIDPGSNLDRKLQDDWGLTAWNSGIADMDTIPVKNLKAVDKPEIRLNIPNKIKLMPIKNHSAIVDPKKNKEIIDQLKLNKTADNQNNINIMEDGESSNNSEMKELIKSSINSKRNRRYSSQNKVNSSFAGTDFRLIEDNCDVNLYDQINKSIMKIEEDENGVAYIEGTNGKRISIFGLKSPIINAKKEHYKDSQDRATYQASTICSNTMNKSSKKSGFKLSYDFFSWGDDEVNQEKVNKNREILNLLSESDFEQIRREIENDYHKGGKELSRSKKSDKRPFSSCVEDPKAEDKDSD